MHDAVGETSHGRSGASLAGTAGTATMTVVVVTERRLRRRQRGPLDYDDSLVPGKIVASIMHLPHVTDSEDNELGLGLRWSYGSAFGLWHGILRRRFAEPWASAAVRRHADERDVLAVPAARADAAAVALAARRDGDMPRHPRRLRHRGGHGRRPRAPAGRLSRTHVGPVRPSVERYVSPGVEHSSSWWAIRFRSWVGAKPQPDPACFPRRPSGVESVGGGHIVREGAPAAVARRVPLEELGPATQTHWLSRGDHPRTESPARPRSRAGHVAPDVARAGGRIQHVDTGAGGQIAARVADR